MLVISERVVNNFVENFHTTGMMLNQEALTRHNGHPRRTDTVDPGTTPCALSLGQAILEQGGDLSAVSGIAEICLCRSGRKGIQAH